MKATKDTINGIINDSVREIFKLLGKGGYEKQPEEVLTDYDFSIQLKIKLRNVLSQYIQSTDDERPVFHREKFFKFISALQNIPMTDTTRVFETVQQYIKYGE